MTDQNLASLVAETKATLESTGVTGIKFVDVMDPREFPTDEAEMGSEASTILDDEEVMVNALIILAGLDPLEMVDDVPLYTEAQRSLIIAAGTTVTGWRAE